ncbi:MAG: hypothetical protein L6Q70_14695, partial [Thauera sp.]|nr:hypothetical protein [Thauera sp.]
DGDGQCQPCARAEVAQRPVAPAPAPPKRGAHQKSRRSRSWMPAAAVSGFYFAHPESHYFAISKIGRDQLEDWARRTGMDIDEAARWLAPLL